MAVVSSNRTATRNRQWASAFLLALFLALQAMAAAPALHAAIHSDAAEPGHECAVTLLLHGQVHFAAGAAPIIAAPVLIFRAEPVPAAVFVSEDVQLLPGRGPPASQVLS